MEMVINFIRWFSVESGKFFPYESRQRDEFYDVCEEYCLEVLEGLYPEYSCYTIDLIVKDIFNYIEDGMGTKDIAMLIRAIYALENREDEVDRVLKEQNGANKEAWKRERIERYVEERREAAEKLINSVGREESGSYVVRSRGAGENGK